MLRHGRWSKTDARTRVPTFLERSHWQQVGRSYEELVYVYDNGGVYGHPCETPK